ncbi:MAG: hypothetical protein DKM50_03355 [Candidatus Margulisiibacteriota bacterium]|nr:MAG: hypothetical protein A2X43_09495 [Candidatus Margulisbacteria bacterium GWD2_39_127]OGI02877.1 MAG: hypothetical protein A2X42_02270 [Candidatus Margulisbacteria bacterium GWF2_38_17]OGI09658.1 MAG: hypothetical protein A2X41_04980 [Candidatus Margulisbacteria bacterium GWE2_39_32]PZM83016.1 MAG: hypothetical protein DKM50_03355 [Candidatus Margulisiibacteriota bacterium]HAR62176.1 hypothetical protein [Candidatus Margulisiibacteriota bacterium]
MKFKTIASLLLFLFLLCNVVFADSKPVATLTVFFGEVLYKNASGSNWALVKRGMFFYPGDRIATKLDGKAEIYFTDGSILRVANESEMEFTIQDNKKKRSVFLVFGKVWNKVTKGTNFEIESIHGVASVKGTEFDVAVKDEMDVWVADGAVEISNDKGKVLSERNTYTRIKKDSEPKKESINQDQLPKRDDMQSKLSLMLNFVGDKVEDKPFIIKAAVKDNKTEKLYKGEVVEVRFVSNDKRMKFSSDNKEWNDEVIVKITDGQGELKVKGQSGQSEFMVIGKNLPGISVEVTIKPEIKAKKISLSYIDSDNKEKNLDLEFERK